MKGIERTLFLRAAIDAGLTPRRARVLAERQLPVTGCESVRLLLKIGTPGADDAVVLAAHRLLSTLESDLTPRLDLIRVCTMAGGLDARCMNHVILVNRDSHSYQRAAQGDALPLASVLLHEYVHQTGGDEAAAYGRELMFLQQHQADPEGSRTPRSSFVLQQVLKGESDDLCL